MNKVLVFSTLCSFALMFCCSGRVSENKPGLFLREAFDIHVESVRNSDSKALFATVADGADFSFSDGMRRSE
jgi:hypothetical protein